MTINFNLIPIRNQKTGLDSKQLTNKLKQQQQQLLIMSSNNSKICKEKKSLA